MFNVHRLVLRFLVLHNTNMPPFHSNAFSARQGSALVLVLTVLVSCVGLVAGVQSRLVSRARLLSQEAAEVELRGALLLGLQEGMRQWSEDETWILPRNETDPQPFWDLRTDSGAAVTIRLRDAQDRLNLNHLNLPVTPEFPRSAMDMLQDLLAMTDPESDPESFVRFGRAVEELEPWFSGVGQIDRLEPATREWRAVRTYLVALPHPRERWLPVNVNTAPPELLEAILGVRFRGWIDTLVRARETGPIMDLAHYLMFLPELVRQPVSRVLDVRSEIAEVTVTAEGWNTRRGLTAWVRRSHGGDVEVIRCRW